MIIGGHLKSSFIDYPDKVSTVFFTRGCNFRCPYCHNSELVLNASGDTESSYIQNFLDKKKKYLDGIVVSGGEPTIHKDLPEFLAWLKTWGLPLKLDTNGTNPKMLRQLIGKGLVDYVAMDIKAPLRKYGEVAAAIVSIQDIQESEAILMDSGIGYEFRTTVAKELLSLADIRKIGQEIHGAKRYALQRFKDNEEVLAGVGKFTSYAPEELNLLQEELGEHIETVLIR
ncbi:anaerobic ribonucleoside-triphosphate reductase activating protein [Clostridia bacterium]|nr:anaerobic ribonucleoside-triphosphate reductase activating protein [Clostridia bacterium]